MKTGLGWRASHATHGGLPGAPSAELHALRLRAKELRYLLEGARPLCVPEPYADLHADLRVLRVALGGVEDAAVITAEIRAVSRGQLRGRSRSAVDPVLATGAFGERFRAREREIRAARRAVRGPHAAAPRSGSPGCWTSGEVYRDVQHQRRRREDLDRRQSGLPVGTTGRRTVLWDLDVQGAATYIFRMSRG